MDDNNNLNQNPTEPNLNEVNDTVNAANEAVNETVSGVNEVAGNPVNTVNLGNEFSIPTYKPDNFQNTQTTPTNNTNPTAQPSTYFSQPANNNFNAGNNNLNKSVNNPYYDPYMDTTPPAEEKKGLSIASLVLGICGLLFSCCACLSIILQILAVIFGSVSLSKKQSGKGMAIAGIVFGIVGFIITIALMIYSWQSGNTEEILQQYSQYYNFN